MNARTLHQNLKKRIIDAQLNKSDLHAVEAYLNDENKYYELLAACFTQLSTNQNQFFIDVLKSKDETAIENEYLGFLLHLATKNKKTVKHLPQEALNEEQFHLISDECLKELKLSKSEFSKLVEFLKNDEQLKQYADWISSKGIYSLHYSEFFSMVFHSKGRVYLNSLLELTNTQNTLYAFARTVLQCYAFNDDAINGKIVGLLSALVKLFAGEFNKDTWQNFEKMAKELEALLEEEPYKLQGNKELRDMGLFVLVQIFCWVMACAIVLPLLIPGLSLVIGLALSATLTLFFISSLWALANSFDGTPEEEVSRLANEILVEGRAYHQFFKEKQEEQREEVIIDDIEEPISGYGCM